MVEPTRFGSVMKVANLAGANFADVESLDRLAEVAADGARQLRERIAANDRAAEAHRAAPPSCTVATT